VGVPMRKVESNGGAAPGRPLADELRSLAQLRMLHSLAQRLNELNDVRQIGEAITAELHTVIEYHNCRVHLLSEDGQMLVPIAFRGELSEYQGETFEALLIPFGAGITGRVAQTGESHYAPNTAEDPTAVNIAGTPDVDESLIVVPMRYGSNVIGTVALAKLGVDQFDDDDVRLLEVLAAHAAVAIENARLFERERSSAQVARELLKFSQTLTGAHDMESVLSQAIRTIPAMILCASVRVYLRDTATGAFRVAASVEGEAEAWTEPLVVPADVAQRFLLSTEEPFVLTRETIATVPEPYRGRGDREAIIAPLHWEPDGFGTIAISGVPGAGPAGTGFSARELELARGIADIASLALGKAGRFRELEEAAERLRALDEMKNMFLDAVSHELRTPLAAVLGIALTLGRPEIDLSDPEERDLINRLQTNARKLERLLSDLLDLDRLVRGIVEPNRRPTDVGALVRGVVEAAELPGGHEVTVQADALVLPVDAAKVERIVENLLANAARHAPDATGIWVGATAVDGGVLITVEDNGPGVPPELRAAVFEPFRQGPDRSQHSPGVGIGLSLVARFAEIHGGRAWVEDRPGGGASFRVFIPGA
jgi:K+-sensing histidine kinase KdpD